GHVGPDQARAAGDEEPQPSLPIMNCTTGVAGGNEPVTPALVYPRSVIIVIPLTCEAASLHRNTSTCACSSAVDASAPTSPRKSVPKPSHRSAFLRARGVSVGPGMMALSRTPFLRNRNDSRAT